MASWKRKKSCENNALGLYGYWSGWDRNTTYFHKVSHGRNHINRIKKNYWLCWSGAYKGWRSRAGVPTICFWRVHVTRWELHGWALKHNWDQPWTKYWFLIIIVILASSTLLTVVWFQRNIALPSKLLPRPLLLDWKVFCLTLVIVINLPSFWVGKLLTMFSLLNFFMWWKTVRLIRMFFLKLDMAKAYDKFE